MVGRSAVAFRNDVEVSEGYFAERTFEVERRQRSFELGANRSGEPVEVQPKEGGRKMAHI